MAVTSGRFLERKTGLFTVLASWVTGQVILYGGKTCQPCLRLPGAMCGGSPDELSLS